MILIVAFGVLIVGLLAGVATLLALMTRDLWRAVTREPERSRQRRLRAAARLTPDEAIAIAAAAARPFPANTLVATAMERDGALVWRVDSMTIDMSVSVLVDDATGAVLAVNHWSGWPER